MSALPRSSPSSSCSWTRAALAPVTRAPPAPETAQTAFHVLADPSLFGHISSFQGGIPVALRQFKVYHDPQPSMRQLWDDITQLIKLVVESGSLRHLEMLQSSQFYENDEWCVPRFEQLALTAARNHRVDILQWMLANGMALSEPDDLWLEAIQGGRSNDDFAVLELLEC